MKKRDTKQIILDEALGLFSVKGYEGVSVADIAAAVNIKASSLYKHYLSKRDIFEKILEKASGAYDSPGSVFGTGGADSEKSVELLVNGGLEALTDAGLEIFRSFLHDGYARKLRKMLSIEQYGDGSAARLLAGQYIDAPLLGLGLVFQILSERGILAVPDADIAAAHFYAPIYLMLNLCDNSPEREGEAVEFIGQHIKQFYRMYARKS